MTKSSVQNAELPQKFNLWLSASPGIKENIVIGKNIQNTEKPRKKGGCRVTAFTVPGMYYEKVYSKFFVFSFDAYSICERNEEKVIRR